MTTQRLAPDGGVDSVLDFGDALVAAFDHVNDVHVFVKDRHRRFTALSAPFAIMLGYRLPQQIVGLRDEELSPEYLADHYRRHDEQILETGEGLIDLVELVRNVNGSYDWFLTTKMPIIDRDGGVVGIVGHTRALTKRDANTEKLLSYTPAVELISSSFHQPLTVDDMAATMSMSSGAFTRGFKEHFSCTPYQYLRRTRIMAACDLLSTSELSLSEISARTGFYDQSHFSRDFKADRGITPTEYRKRFNGVRSQHAARVPFA
jgi:PAS domain S-box-containing protein